MSSSSSPGDPSKSSNPSNPNPAPNTGGAPPSSPDNTPQTIHGFARPPPDFNPAPLSENPGRGLLNSADAVEESIEQEITRKIAELEVAKGEPVTDEEKKKISSRIRALRQGAWLEGLKLQLVGKDTVPIQYFNRLVADHEGTIAIVAQVRADADRKVTDRDAEIEKLKNRKPEVDPALISERERLLGEIRHVREENTQIRRELRTQRRTNDAALASCNNRVQDLQKQLDTCRNTASDYYNEVQTLRQQKMETNSREQVNKDEIRKLRAEQEGSQKHIKELETERVNCKARCKALETENRKLKDAAIPQAAQQAAPQGGPDDTEDLRKRIVELEATIAERDQTIRTLEAQLKQAGGSPAPPRPIEEVANAELQARCTELREARDRYRERWARGFAEENVEKKPHLVEFWQVVEDTKKEIDQLYQGIHKLGQVLGLADGVLDTPKILDRIVKQVTASVSDVLGTPQLTIINLRTANSTAQVQIETLQRRIERAQLGRSEDEVNLALGTADEQEIERRVTVRTQAYREHRGRILSHMLEAQTAFLNLAARSSTRVAIEDIVDRFLQPESLPMVELPPNHRQRQR
ncbi:hypothetical protein GGR51DRAFT_510240 [Nemania sp. FL0031]|nr:hypothetical protein GGR51DRAFT_510240 [Nemania sp. FL0031]